MTNGVNGEQAWQWVQAWAAQQALLRDRLVSYREMFEQWLRYVQP